MNRSRIRIDRPRAARRRAARPAVEGLEGRQLLSVATGTVVHPEGRSPAEVARARNQAGNSPDVPQLNTPAPSLTVGLYGADDPSESNVVLSPKVAIQGLTSIPYSTVWLARGPRGHVTTAVVSGGDGYFRFDIVALPGDNLVRIFAGSASNLGTASQFSEPTDFHFTLADPVVGWDAIAVKANEFQGQTAPEAARNLAILHVAQYDAIASIRAPGTAFHDAVTAPRGASEVAAAHYAAFTALTSLLPGQSALFDKALASAMAGLPNTKSIRDGFDVGRAAAASTLDWRDRQNALPSPAGFAISDPAVFLPGEPPAVGTPAFDAAFGEVRTLGVLHSPTRTDRQTLTAQFWHLEGGTPTNPGLWNQAAERLATQAGGNLRANARTFAMLDVALADAALVSRAAKMTYRIQHPMGVIRQIDPTWEALVSTPGDFSYVSDQAAYASAASSVLSSKFGARTPVTVSSSSLGTTRVYETLAAAADDAALSGVYGGVQFGFDVSAGTKVGEDVALEVLASFPKAKPGSR